MRAPRGGWLLAAGGALALLLLLSGLSGAPLDTLSIDLRHRAVALTAPHAPLDRTPASGSAALNPVGVNVFLEQEVEPEKRQRSLELLRAAGVGWIRQQLPWEQ